VEIPELPEDLSRLERELARRPRPAPSDAMRRCVMAAVQRELAALPHRQIQPAGAWEFAVATAAAVLLVANLAISAANDMDWRLGARLDRAAVASAAEDISRLAPELTPNEVNREALLLVAGGRLLRMPCVKGTQALPTRLQEQMLLAPGGLGRTPSPRRRPGGLRPSW
jgi:hypothetical protein